jgi:MSHA pilin protein MshC
VLDPGQRHRYQLSAALSRRPDRPDGCHIKAGNEHSVRSPFASGGHHCAQRGFTLPELIAVMVVLGIITAVAAPRMWGSGYDESRLYQETSAALRYAQSAALSMQRIVCVTFTAGSVTLTYRSAYTLTTTPTLPACDTNLIPPGGGPAPYVVQAAGSAAFTTPAANATLRYDWLGRPYDAAGVALNAQRAINLSGGLQILVEAQSGYVH